MFTSKEILDMMATEIAEANEKGRAFSPRSPSKDEPTVDIPLQLVRNKDGSLEWVE